ncbi:MAG: F0F1 ATP synthase subunit B [Planctomycetales bacterium]|nr:F0F1 ATP synthase subunit B [Planctomycetales bacterium]
MMQTILRLPALLCLGLLFAACCCASAAEPAEPAAGDGHEPAAAHDAAAEHGGAAEESAVDAEHDHAGDGAHEHGDGESHDEHSGASHGNTNPLSIDPDLAIVTLIIFALLVIILGKFARGPIMEGLEKREKSVADNIAAAEMSNREAQKILGDYQTQLAKASDEVRAMLDGAKKDAEAMKHTIIAEAQKAASDEKDRAKREIDAAKKSALGEIAQQSVNIAFRVASDAVRREIKADDHRGLVEDALKQFSSEN